MKYTFSEDKHVCCIVGCINLSSCFRSVPFRILILKLFLSSMALNYTYTCDLMDYDDHSELAMRVSEKGQSCH